MRSTEITLQRCKVCGEACDWDGKGESHCEGKAAHGPFEIVTYIPIADVRQILKARLESHERAIEQIKASGVGSAESMAEGDELAVRVCREILGEMEAI